VPLKKEGQLSKLKYREDCVIIKTNTQKKKRALVALFLSVANDRICP
jgi:hypothetical protein